MLLHVTDFLHYLFVAAPVSFTQSDCEPFRAYLDNKLGQFYPVVHSVKIVMKENILGFQGNQKSPYLKITVNDPRQIRKLRECIEEGGANYKGLWKAPEDGILTFDDIQYTIRFMIDNAVRRYCFWNASQVLDKG